jgi:hypothetical protein
MLKTGEIFVSAKIKRRFVCGIYCPEPQLSDVKRHGTPGQSQGNRVNSLVTSE